MHFILFLPKPYIFSLRLICLISFSFLSLSSYLCTFSHTRTCLVIMRKDGWLTCSSREEHYLLILSYSTSLKYVIRMYPFTFVMIAMIILYYVILHSYSSYLISYILSFDSTWWSNSIGSLTALITKKRSVRKHQFGNTDEFI